MPGSSVLLVGCGRMGSALVRGWTGSSVVVIEPQPVGDLPDGVVRYAVPADIPKTFAPALVVFAVKPQQMDEVAPLYARFRTATFLSIAAGRTIAGLQRQLGASAAVVRAMPNTPAAIGRGITVCVASPQVTPGGRDLVQGALAAGGQVEWLDDEAGMDAVTALSGSGPAYVFLLVEVLAQAGEEMGLPAELAMKLARQTVIGSGHLLEQSPQHAGALRAAVTSPGGTTAAALAVLEGNQALAALFTRALQAARQRGRELAG